jgi:hypothetical protein
MTEGTSVPSALATEVAVGATIPVVHGDVNVSRVATAVGDGLTMLQHAPAITAVAMATHLRDTLQMSSK